MECDVKYYHEKNDELLNSSVNKTFEELLSMSKEEFRDWVIELRKTVVYLWDNKNIPPKTSVDKFGIIDQFRQMEYFPVHEFEFKDALTGSEVIRNNNIKIGNSVNQWFPTMMKTRINYGNSDTGKSIYDYFNDDELLDTFITYSTRHFKRDSFYNYSLVAKVNDKEYVGQLPFADNGKEWIEIFERDYRKKNQYDYWLDSKEQEADYTGYNDKLNTSKYLIIHRNEIEQLDIPEKSKSNINYEKSEYCRIRFYKFNQKIFPSGLKAFRISFCQPAVNFPPLTAKYLYDRYTEHFKNQDLIRIYDPSAGWGGRLLGAMAIKRDRNVLYIGTDPNTDHSTHNNRTKYEEIADFYRKHVNKGGLWSDDYTHTQTEIYQLGSEEIGKNLDFQKHKGKIDLVFTSPPYFAKEAYSEDPEQSYKKFSEYDSWVEGFLKPTLMTSVEYLRSDRYLLWNIADASFNKKKLPLEKDSIDILESLGMIYKGKLMMALAQMPGGNRVDKETGLPKTKNFCKVNGIWLKYEPIFVFYKK